MVIDSPKTQSTALPTAPTAAIVEVQGLSKRYGKIAAVRGVDFVREISQQRTFYATGHNKSIAHFTNHIKSLTSPLSG